MHCSSRCEIYKVWSTLLPGSTHPSHQIFKQQNHENRQDQIQIHTTDTNQRKHTKPNRNPTASMASHTSNPAGPEDMTLAIPQETQARFDALRLDSAKCTFVGFSHRKEDDCPICREPFKEPDLLIQDQCQQTFCTDCFLDWAKLSKECPYCRQTIVALFSGSDTLDIFREDLIESIEEDEISISIIRQTFEGSERLPRIIRILARQLDEDLWAHTLSRFARNRDLNPLISGAFADAAGRTHQNIRAIRRAVLDEQLLTHPLLAELEDRFQVMAIESFHFAMRLFSPIPSPEDRFRDTQRFLMDSALHIGRMVNMLEPHIGPIEIHPLL